MNADMEFISMSREGRELEEIVSLIEKALVRSNTKIRSPDILTDRITGGKREVDVSIKYNLFEISF
jgi:hypothetical protein